MQSFLEKTIQYLFQNYADHISDLCIVLPNRRAGLFLRQHLAQVINTPIWTPDIFASEDFISNLSGLYIPDNITLLFDLYEVYKRTAKNPESFEEFSQWGNVLLYDFNEVDRYLIDANKLYANLRDIREVENWSLSDERLTEIQQNYLAFWNSLGNYYNDFKEYLLSKNEAYQGLAYRITAENIDKYIHSHSWHKIIFVGFNALNTAEERIIEKLTGLNKAEIIWDSDEYYTKNKQQEAGKFIRQYQARFNKPNAASSTFLFEENLLSTKSGNINVIGAAGNISQAKVAADIIEELLKKNNNLSDTAIVLADENLLFPLLYALPDGVNDINVTMGYPLKNTPIASFVERLIKMQENAIKLSKGKGFYFKDVIQFVEHPLCSWLFRDKEQRRSLRALTGTIKTKNLIFVAPATLKKYFGDGWNILLPYFSFWESPDAALLAIYSLLDTLKSNLLLQQKEDQTSRRHFLSLEYISAYIKVIKKIRSLQETYGHISTTDILYNILRQLAGFSSLPFYGEPLSGLQIMGVLETRTLDFENVILLSANEDILPSGKTQNSFIPFDLKRVFGLPLYNDKDAVFGYHFYRLIQRAGNTYLVYNTETDTFGSGEKSRFITQLLHELPQKNKFVQTKESIVQLPVNGPVEATITIDKTPEIIKKIHDQGNYGFSPSSLNTYRNCSLQFYFHYIAGLKEKEDVEEAIGADTLGTVIHQVLQELYEPFINKVLSVEDVSGMKQKAGKLIQAAFSKVYSDNELNYGKNLLTYHLALKFIDNFLSTEKSFLKESDKRNIGLSIKTLEKDLQAEITLDKIAGYDQTQSVTVKIKGIADRIDQYGDTMRIIDYKTGKADDNELKVKDWNHIVSDSRLNKSFQLLMYAFMYRNSINITPNQLVSGILTFRQLSAGLKPVSITGEKYLSDDILNEFKNQLKELLNRLYDVNGSFSQTTDIERCRYCDYKVICNRQS